MEDEEAEDRISDLPDAILHLILSLVPTKSVLTTSSLSRRWREISADHLAHTNSLDFGEDFAKRQTPDQFTDTLNRILSVNNSDKIDKFKLFFSPRNEEHKSNAISWIQFATSRSIREINFDFCRHIHQHFLSRAHVVGRNEAFELPSFLFDCKSLVSVKLSRCILALPEKYAGFDGLQTLCLKEVHVTDSMLERLLCNCPLLEVLVLKECGSLSRIRVHSPTRLKRLTIYECYNTSVLEVSGANIRSLMISAGHLDLCNLENMAMLEEVFIGTRGDEFGGVLYIFKQVLSDIAHVRALTLYLGHLVPSLMKDFQVNFCNLQELQLVNSPLFGLFNTDVYCFLRHCSCPSLQKITIELSTVAEEENFIWEYRKPTVEPIECVFNNLRSVELRNYRGTSSDIELAAYFLERAPVLESMLLITPQKSNANNKTVVQSGIPCSTSKQDEIINRVRDDVIEVLLYQPTASPIAEIRVSEGGEHKNLVLFFKRHHVSDVYNK